MAIDFMTVVRDTVLVSSGAISAMQALPEGALGLALRKITLGRSASISFPITPEVEGIQRTGMNAWSNCDEAHSYGCRFTRQYYALIQQAP